MENVYYNFDKTLKSLLGFKVIKLWISFLGIAFFKFYFEVKCFSSWFYWNLIFAKEKLLGPRFEKEKKKFNKRKKEIIKIRHIQKKKGYLL